MAPDVASTAAFLYQAVTPSADAQIDGSKAQECTETIEPLVGDLDPVASWDGGAVAPTITPSTGLVARLTLSCMLKLGNVLRSCGHKKGDGAH